IVVVGVGGEELRVAHPLTLVDERVGGHFEREVAKVIGCAPFAQRHGAQAAEAEQQGNKLFHGDSPPYRIPAYRRSRATPAQNLQPNCKYTAIIIVNFAALRKGKK